MENIDNFIDWNNLYKTLKKQYLELIKDNYEDFDETEKNFKNFIKTKEYSNTTMGVDLEIIECECTLDKTLNIAYIVFGWENAYYEDEFLTITLGYSFDDEKLTDFIVDK